MKNLIQILALTLILPILAEAEVPPAVYDNIQGAKRIGETRVNVLFWDLYDLSLYAADQRYSPDRPFALRLRYLRKIEGQVIAEKSIEEMRRQGISEVKLAAWFTQLEGIFPDVREGTELIGIFVPGQPTRFYEGELFLGKVMDPEFGKPFSDIWLGPNSSIPRIRASLINESVE